MDLLAWLALALTYFEHAHAEPNEISVSVEDEEESKGHSLQSLRNLISKNLPVSSITLYATMPSYFQVMFGWTALHKSLSAMSGRGSYPGPQAD